MIAPDAAAARTLITSVARRMDRSVRLDLDPDRRDIADWAQAHGLAIAGETAFVLRGGPWPPVGQHDRLFCPLTVLAARRLARSPLLPADRGPRLTERGWLTQETALAT